MNPIFLDLTPSDKPFVGTYVPHNVRDAFYIVSDGTKTVLFKMIKRASHDSLQVYEVNSPITPNGKTIQKKISEGIFPIKHQMDYNRNDPGAHIVDGRFQFVIVDSTGIRHTCQIGF
jgi:hypothetical protein